MTIPKPIQLDHFQYEDLKKQRDFLKERIPFLDRYKKKKYELRLKLTKKRIDQYEKLHRGFELTI